MSESVSNLTNSSIITLSSSSIGEFPHRLCGDGKKNWEKRKNVFKGLQW
ncbi:hypothetical protein LCGC14_1065360 [marine sediment metagenome]|uniref:Uncharacterized protein n=1 Tax=marine sediment metagenome TaxID=412755 RepID=A0A0F9MJU9_9ZZZZ